MFRAVSRRLRLRFAQSHSAELQEIKAELGQRDRETAAFLHRELAALRAEMQAERLTFVHALEQLRQNNEMHQRHEQERVRRITGDSGLTRLVETLDAALLTLVLNGPLEAPAVYSPSSVNSEAT